ncbi:unnamed protein product [Protopolystoma xenopodis]|uniref:HAP1 N-terminal domain-containing protein n=1 Tax=Protopolystoma xenopodis TaxID=117903 RepID=A0A448WGX6_9PLAT|nr:unnamed protein product [Protopolystoma xenopodis]
MLFKNQQRRLTESLERIEEHDNPTVRNCLHQLAEANLHLRNLTTEVTKKTESHLVQQAEVSRLHNLVVELEGRLKQVLFMI